jgi:hypothetical protein
MTKLIGIGLGSLLLIVFIIAPSSAESGNGDAGARAAQAGEKNEVFHLVGFDGEYDNGTSGATKTINWKNGNKQRILLSEATVSLAFLSPGVVGNFILVVVQDGSGKRTVSWPSEVKWPGGAAPELTKRAGAVDAFSFYYNGKDYLGNASLDYR